MANPRPGALDPKLAEILTAEIKRQPITGKSSRTIAHELGVHFQTVANYRRKMERRGLIDRLPRGGTRLRREGLMGVVGEANLALGLGVPGPASVSLQAAEFLSKLDSIENLTPEQIIKRLTWLSVSPEVPYPTQVVAAKALYEIQEAERSRASLQRDVPKTREEAIAHLKIVRSCVGPVMWEDVQRFVTEEEESWKTSRSIPSPPEPSAPTPSSDTLPSTSTSLTEPPTSSSSSESATPAWSRPSTPS
jgi:hypothetical protein